MAMLTITKAAKAFDVSRPTLLKHLKNGTISGEKDAAKGWQIDAAELARVYAKREMPGEKPLPSPLPPVASASEADLRAEIEQLKAALARSEGIADERRRQLDQLVPLLAAPKRRRWRWPWG